MNTTIMDATMLITLLSELPPGAFECRAIRCEAVARDHAMHYHVTGPVPIKEIRDIYRMRARSNARKGSPIKGFDDLLVGLEDHDVSAVLLHDVKAAAGNFLAFTDASGSKILGLLEFTPMPLQEPPRD